MNSLFGRANAREAHPKPLITMQGQMAAIAPHHARIAVAKTVVRPARPGIRPFIVAFRPVER
jgi:hypothetical protein